MKWACGTQCFEVEFAQGAMSINAFLPIVSMLGFDGVEFLAEHLPSLRSNYANILRQRLEENELSLSVISYRTNEPKNLTSAVEPLLSFAREMRARVVCIGGADEWKPFANEIKQLSQLSEQISLPLGLALPQKVGASKELCDLLDDIASPYLGVCMLLKAETNPNDEFWQDLVMVSPFTLHVQLVVTDLARSLTWLPALELLREVEYDGFISIIHVPNPVEDSLKLISSQLALMAR